MLPSSSTGYKVGALSDLISGGGGEEQKKTKKRTDFSGLFTTAKRQREPEVQPVVEAKIATKVSDEAGESNKKKKKKRNRESDLVVVGAEDADAAAMFTKPSLKSLVRQEDNKPRQLDEEKESRTVFVGNLPSSIKKKKLRLLFSQFGEVDTVRLRGAARPDLKTTKKVAVIKKSFHEGRTNINAYVRFMDKECAEKSCYEMNGTDIDGFVVRVDLALKSKDHEASKGIFLGNLGFALEEDAVRSHFARCGEIVDVRLIRDSATGIGKGFGYVNFAKRDGVALAMELNGSVLGGRPVRIERCAGMNVKRNKGGGKSNNFGASSSKQTTTTMKKKEKKKKAEPPQFQGRMSEKGGGKKGGVAKKTKEERRRKMVSRKLLAK